MSEYKYLVGCDADGNISPNVKVAEGVTVAQVRSTLAQVGGYKTRTISGTASINAVEAGTWALDLSGDTTLTINGANGTTIVLDLALNGHSLIIADGPEVTADGKIAVNKSRDIWTGGAGGSSQVAVTPTPPTWHDDPDNGENTYTIPTKTGVRYLVGGTVKAAGTYPAAASSTVTVTAELTDTDKYYLSDSAYTSWSHTFPAASVTLLGSLDLSTVADGTDISTLTLQPGNISIAKVGGGASVAAFSGGKYGLKTAGTTQVYLSLTHATLPKYRVTSSYSIDTNANTALEMAVGPSSYASCRIRNGALTLGGNTNFTWTTQVDPAGWSVPVSGVISFEWDASQAGVTTATVRVDGVVRGQISTTASGVHGSAGNSTLSLISWNNGGAYIGGTMKVEAIS